MDAFEKMAALSAGSKLEVESAQECHPVIDGKHFAEIPISEVAMPGGKRMKVVKTLLTSACERDCHYCPFRAGRKMRRQTLKAEEFAKTFFEVFRSGAAEGLLLSSGIIKGGVQTQDRLLDVADILRNKLGYHGYLHLKIMPGAEKEQVLRAMELANRISVNLEGANPARLGRFAPMKDFMKELMMPLIWAQEARQGHEARNTWNGRWASSTTQFVVGATEESDLELLATSEHLYKKQGLQRVYYSAFFPILDTPLEGLAPASALRERRIYEGSFLLRDYGFEMEALPFDQQGNLPLDIDPKLAWAQQTLLRNPIEVNTASRERLLQIPGIGPRGAQRILNSRGRHKIASINDLRNLGIQTKRVRPFILMSGKQADFQYQLM